MHTFQLVSNTIFMVIYYWTLTVTLSCEYFPTARFVFPR